MPERLLEIKDLELEFMTEYGLVRALDGIDLEIRERDFVGLVGESGAGKTVTGLAMMGLLPGNAIVRGGKIIFKGQDLLNKTEEEMHKIRGRSISMIFQNPMNALNPSMRIGEQISEMLRSHAGVSKAEAHHQALEMLKKVRIPEPERRANDYPHQFSGGMRQRVLIAMALLCHPNLLIADEPTTGLDVTVQAQILDLVKDLRQDFGSAILWITHNVGVVAQYCSSINIIYGGQLMETATITGEFFRNPLHPYTQGLLASIPKFQDRKTKLSSIKGTIPELKDMPAGCRFHTRCPYAHDICKAEGPKLEEVSKDHQVACLRLDRVSSMPWTTDEECQALELPSAQESGIPLLQMRNLRKYFPAGRSISLQQSMPPISFTERNVHAIEDVSIELRRGETFGLVGESGCGKSTLGFALVKLHEPSSGQILFKGKDAFRLSPEDNEEYRRSVQIVFQDPDSTLNPRKRVLDIIGRQLTHFEVTRDKEDTLEKATRLLAEVGLDERFLYRYPHELSSGQRQRVAIARALASEPEFIVADEITSSLDVSIQASVLNLLMDLQRRKRLAYLLITHDLSVVYHMSDKVGVMYLGQLMELGTTVDVFSPPSHPYTEALLSAIPVADPFTRRKRIILEGPVPSPISPPAGCTFHTRCHRRIGRICENDTPPLREISEGHYVRCYLDSNQLQQVGVLEEVSHETASA